MTPLGFSVIFMKLLSIADNLTYMHTYSCHTIHNLILVVTNKSIITEVFMRKPYNLLFFLRMAILANVMILK